MPLTRKKLLFTPDNLRKREGKKEDCAPFPNRRVGGKKGNTSTTSIARGESVEGK